MVAITTLHRRVTLLLHINPAFLAKRVIHTRINLTKRANQYRRMEPADMVNHILLQPRRRLTKYSFHAKQEKQIFK
jgi:hypothetical protein